MHIQVLLYVLYLIFPTILQHPILQMKYLRHRESS